ncbi:MAG: ATPase [Cyclobacteriaceae bacterium]
MNSQFESDHFPFDECLSLLESAGKKTYGAYFQIIEEDHSVFFKLLVYFLRDEAKAKELGIDFKKGILLTGPIGCGKTSIMNLMRYISAAFTHHIMISCRDVSFQFIQDGYSIIQKYSDNSFRFQGSQKEPKIYCFDDLGAENTFKYFGNDCNVMAEVILSRYDLIISHEMKTHITTNLNSSEIQSIYGNRVRSRMREMFNLVSFDSMSRDKRV